jgi:hypothetical protein
MRLQAKQKGRAGERGIVLVIALLVLLSLAGLALVATFRVTNEIERGGNQIAGKDGQTLTRLVFFSALALAQTSGSAMFGSPQMAGAMVFDRTHFDGLGLYQAGADGTFNRETPDDRLDYGARFQRMGQVTGNVAGFAPDQFAFARVALTGWSEFGTVVPGDDITRVQRIDRRMRALLLAGPYPTGVAAP